MSENAHHPSGVSAIAPRRRLGRSMRPNTVMSSGVGIRDAENKRDKIPHSELVIPNFSDFKLIFVFFATRVLTLRSIASSSDLTRVSGRLSDLKG